MDTRSKAQEYTIRIMKARMSLMTRNGFYGILLMHMKYALDESVRTAATDGERMFFAPSFLDEISDKELMFIMQHEILHVVLKHCLRTGDRNGLAFNVACDIVVNSTILMSAGGDVSSITLARYGESMHLAPDGREGCEYTAEEVYEMMKEKGWTNNLDIFINGSFSDEHSRWGTSKVKGLSELWTSRIKDAYEAAKRGSDSLPAGLRRALGEMLEPRTDWKTVLNDFIQEEITDYSFTPPDRRFSESPFYLPDFNEMDDIIRNILFMIDTSGSMTEEEITEAYSEIKGAIDQFGGKLEGWLGFFDSEVYEPKPFAEEDEFLDISPYGGGGTSFQVIFDYVREEMKDLEITGIIIMTDGMAVFPEESETMGIPVLWMINNEEITPPWGVTIRI